MFLYLFTGFIIAFGCYFFYKKQKELKNKKSNTPINTVQSALSSNRSTEVEHAAIRSEGHVLSQEPKPHSIPLPKRKVSAPASNAEQSKNEQELFIAEIKQNVHYFSLLNKEEQQLFLKRTWMYLHTKDFQTRKMPELSWKKKVLISSYAAQITFGYTDVSLAHFRTIIVYPEAYRSPVTNQLHKGETNRAGALVFSLKDLEAGHSNPMDGINLALHEFAHAFQIENEIPNSEYRFIDDKALMHFAHLAQIEMADIRRNSAHILRAYGATNQKEFFAVTVEHFFEKPKELQQHLPELFKVVSQILNQNPLKSPVRLQPFL